MLELPRIEELLEDKGLYLGLCVPMSALPVGEKASDSHG